jgi:hypothetical protein
MRRVRDGWAMATKVIREKQEIHREVTADFPRQKDGNIDLGWGAQDTVPK